MPGYCKQPGSLTAPTLRRAPPGVDGSLTGLAPSMPAQYRRFGDDRRQGMRNATQSRARHTLAS